MQRLSRRQLVVGGGLASAGLLVGCGRLPFQASPQDQPPAKVHRIGWLAASAPGSRNAQAFLHGMRERGYIEGQNLAIEWQVTEGRTEQLSEMAAALVRLPVDVILAVSPPPTIAAMEATTNIPIVFVGVSDPVGLGLVASHAHPGGNLTGQTNLVIGMRAKQLELLKETAPGASRVAVLWHTGNSANALVWRELEDAAPVLGVQLLSLEVRSVGDFERVLEAAARERADALLVPPDPFTSGTRAPQVLDFAARHRLPSMYNFRSDVEAGALMSYGPSLPALYQRAAYYVDRVLTGTKPADLPVEQPMRFDFVVNMKTARGLGITFPPEVALQITEVIE